VLFRVESAAKKVTIDVKTKEDMEASRAIREVMEVEETCLKAESKLNNTTKGMCRS
jgi:flagellar biosynthesis regulator FlbT